VRPHPRLRDGRLDARATDRPARGRRCDGRPLGGCHAPGAPLRRQAGGQRTRRLPLRPAPVAGRPHPLPPPDAPPRRGGIILGSPLMSREFQEPTMADFLYEDLLPVGEDTTEYRLLTTEGVSTVEGPDGTTFLRVAPEAIRLLTETAMHDISHYLRSDHLAQVASILDDPEASENDKFVALDLLKNANIAAGGVLPMCQDTGTAIVKGERGQHVLTTGPDEESVARGVYDAFTRLNLRYSQNAPITMWEEKNTGTNLPAQIEIGADTTPGHENSYEFLFMAKGGGSANKSFLYQETKAILNPDRMMQFIEEKIRSLGTAACPPYHLAIVVGGTSAEYTVKTAKLASAHYLDELPREGDITGRGFRDVELEAKVFELTQQIGIGAQFGGKCFCHDVRVVRLPRHGASLPVAIAVSCSADRQARAKITPEGVFLERLEF